MSESEDKKLKAKDKRLQRLYGITLADYNKMLENQGRACAICRRPPATLPLSVDHDHKWKYLRIISFEHASGWQASVAIIQPVFAAPRYFQVIGVGSTRKEAVSDLKKKLKSASVRGAVCFSCNGGLRKFGDNSQRLENAAAYLRRHQERL